MKIWRDPAESLTNATDFPSGEKAGLSSSPAKSVSRRNFIDPRSLGCNRARYHNPAVRMATTTGTANSHLRARRVGGDSGVARSEALSESLESAFTGKAKSPPHSKPC